MSSTKLPNTQSIMAFMTPLVKKRYEIYDHTHKSNPEASLHLKSLKLVSKLYRIVISGGNGKNGGGKSAEKKADKPVVVSSTKRATVPNIPKIQIHTIPSIVPVVVPKLPVSRPQSTTQAISIPKPKTQRLHPNSPSKSPSVSPRSKSPNVSPRSSSPNGTCSISPPSRPIPHIRRTMRDSVTNRVYSYSVSIPDYVPEENEEDLEADEAETFSTISYCRQFSSSAPHMTSHFEYQNSSQLAAPH